MNKDERRQQFYKEHPIIKTQEEIFKEERHTKYIERLKQSLKKYQSISALREKGLTYREIGEQYNVSRQRIQQILN